MTTRTLVTLVTLAALGAAAPVAAEEAATRAQVEQLQKQLADMKKEMDAMQKALSENEAKGGSSSMMHGPMHEHMMGMREHWKQMHDQTCMMAPGSCPEPGAAKK